MLIVEIAQYLDSHGLVTYKETGTQGSCFIGHMPPDPDEAVAIFQYGGATSSMTHGYDTPRVQVRVRGTLDPRVGLQKAQQIYERLHGFHDGKFTSDGFWIVYCQGLQAGPVHIGPDANGRYEYTLNFEIEIKNQTLDRE